MRLPKKKDRRNDILTSAFELFLNKGFLATSMSDIAAKAGVSTSHLYNFFKNKAEIAIAVEQQMIESYYQTLDAPSEEGEPGVVKRDDLLECFDKKRPAWIVTILTEALRNERVREEVMKNGATCEAKVLKRFGLDPKKRSDVFAYQVMSSTVLGLMIRNMFSNNFTKEELAELSFRITPKIMEIGKEAAEEILSKKKPD